MAFYINKHLGFIDSLQFMGSSLEKLAGNLSEEGFIYTREYFYKGCRPYDPADPQVSSSAVIERERQFQFMKKKGVYPCDYMDSFCKFNEVELPK